MPSLSCGLSAVVPDGALRLGVAGLNFLFPPRCPACGHSGTEPTLLPQLCSACEEAMLFPLPSLCRRCGRKVVGGPLKTDDCPRCRREKCHFELVITLGPYEGTLRQAILRMKHADEQSLTAALGVLIGLRADTRLGSDRPDLLVGMPMYWTRRLLRGSNGAEILAETAGRQMQRPANTRILRYCRQTQKQSLLSPAERQKNVRGALQLTKTCDLTGKHVALVDDTLTTGATASEASRVLRAGGARRVTVLVAARAARD
jgi:ComF family protein